MSDNNFAEAAYERYLMSPKGQMMLARQAESQLERFGRQQMGNAAKGSKYLNAEDTIMDQKYNEALEQGDMTTVNAIHVRYGQKVMEAKQGSKAEDNRAEMDKIDARIQRMEQNQQEFMDLFRKEKLAHDAKNE